MNERKPYFLYGALAVPALWIAYALFAALIGSVFGNHSNGDLGNWGNAMIVTFGLLATSEVVGVVCSGISVARRERFRELGFLCLGIYSIPLALAAFILILNFGATKGQQVMNDENRQAHPERFSH
jgi:hypothetical protein